MTAQNLVAEAHNPAAVTRAIEAIAGALCVHDVRGLHLWLTGILAPVDASASRN